MTYCDHFYDIYLTLACLIGAAAVHQWKHSEISDSWKKSVFKNIKSSLIYAKKNM